MQSLERSEHYTDMGEYAVATGVKVVDLSEWAKIVDRLWSEAENSVLSTNPAGLNNCPITETSLRFSCQFLPIGIGTTFND